MKRRLLFVAAAVLLLAAGCTKEKSCRCAVRGTANVRIIKIDNGNCEQLSVYQYHNDRDSLVVDSIVCTDYPFLIDGNDKL